MHQEISDVNLATYLITCGVCKLVRIANGNGRRKTFILDPEPTDQQKAEFYNGTGLVSALDFSTRLRSLKAAVSSGNGGAIRG